MKVPEGHQGFAEPVPGVRIGGSAWAGAKPHMVEVTDPTTGEVLASVLGGGKEAACRAADVACSALEGWSATPPALRAACLNKVAAALRSEAGDLARLITLETGKRLAEAISEVELSAAFFEWFAATSATLSGAMWNARPGTTHYVERRPLGVVAVLTPWNFPVSIPARKLAAALGAGCAALFKPSDAAPLSGLLLAELLEDSLPSGVVGTVVGPSKEVANAWLDNPRVKGVTFTGSTRVGGAVASRVAGRFARTVLELGGCAPFIVLEDADLDAALQCLMVAKLRNNGQSCIAANVAWVPTPALAEIVESLEQSFAALEVGDPLEERTDLGPTCLPSDPPRLGALVEEARARGATVLAPAEGAAGGGFFAPPTICVAPEPGSRVLVEEIFGPVLPVVPYDDLDAAVEQASSSRYGLAGYVCGSDLDAAMAVAARLDVGLVGVNTGTPNTPQVPFAPRGDSGLGVEGGWAGLEQFLTYQIVAVSPLIAARR